MPEVLPLPGSLPGHVLAYPLLLKAGFIQIVTKLADPSQALAS